MINAKSLGLLIAILASLLAYFCWSSTQADSGLFQVGSSMEVQQVMGAGQATSDSKAQQALRPREFRFPADHAPHAGFDTEWWYVTGNLHQKEQPRRRFGFQLTLFRQALPEPSRPSIDSTPARPSPNASSEPRSAWRTSALWMEHVALSDSQSNGFSRQERFSREALKLAGSELDQQGLPRLFLGNDWLRFDSEKELSLRQTVEQSELQLQFRWNKPPILQGKDLKGLSQKGPLPGQASYYYSIPRLEARGTIQKDGQSLAVEGDAWLDREWSSHSLPPELRGWDWICLQFEDQTELMFYRLRQKDGTISPLSCGSFTDAQGHSVPVELGNLTIEPLRRWTSPRTGLIYPVEWSLKLSGPKLPTREFRLTARMDDQEMPLSIRYWEGAVDVAGGNGSPPGVGYLEMVGYSDKP